MNKTKNITVTTVKEIIRQLLTTTYSNHHIARVLDVAPNTVRRYRKLLNNMTFDWSHYKVMHDDALLAHFNRKKQPNKDKRQPDWHYIHHLMQANKHQTLIQLWEEYRSIEPNTAYGQSQFNYYYRQYIKKLDVSMRQTHYAGECVYVDYAGKTIPWTDSETGKVHTAQIFVGVFGCSQYIFACASKSQKVEDFIDSHNQMFQFFGGVPEVLVPDNLKSAVIKAGKIPTINRTYLELSQHYDCVIEPARVRKPQDKSLAEIGVLLVTRWITVVLRRQQFFSVDEINQAVQQLLPKLNQRPFKRIQGNRLERFQSLDKPVLKALPSKSFAYGTWIKLPKVSHDYHVLIDEHAYSVPYQFINEQVEARISHNTVEVFSKNQRIATHVKNDQVNGCTTNDAHRPEKHRAYAKQNAEHYKQWAKAIGDASFNIITAQFTNRADYSMVGIEASSKLQSLAKLYGNERFEAACQCAVDIGSPTVKSIRSILQCNIDTKQKAALSEQVALPLHHNIRGADYYRQGGALC